MSWPSTMSRIDTLTRSAKSTAPQRILSGLRSSETNKSRDRTDGLDLVPAQGVSAVKRDLTAVPNRPATRQADGLPDRKRLRGGVFGR
jgi:hypothetical protein